ncbi:ABC transporter ATP-binding protein [Acidobacteriota bacterium]
MKDKRETPVICAKNLKKIYGKLKAVDGISFEVRRGEIFGIVGPNGAGKTTTIECLEGLRKPDGGDVRVLGLDPSKERRKLNLRMGVQLQQAMLANQIKVWEALHLFSSFYPKSLNPDRILRKLDLSDIRHTVFRKLSGGQKQRLFIALAIIHDPELLFLDELTTGLDPLGRRSIWDFVLEINSEGKTIVLSSHFMEEAEKLCDRVAILAEGKILALDSPEKLIEHLDVERKVYFSFKGNLRSSDLTTIPTVTKVEMTNGRAVVMGRGESFIADIVIYLTEKRVKFADLRTEQPNLEDVYFEFTKNNVEPKN